jgi:aryl-alcohol dehydrogenase-like predicted oxidoreductase
MTDLRQPDIRRRRFGRTDLHASEFGLGCARIGGIFQREPAEFLNLLTAAFDAGINFFDTADIYSQGESERLLGRAFRGRREQVIIASKAGYILPAQRRIMARLKPLVRPLIGLFRFSRRHLPATLSGSPAQDFSPSHIRRAVEGSLRRLGTDRIDVFQLHSPRASVVEHGEWVELLEQLRREGKIRYYGVSCDSVDAAFAALEHQGVSSIQVVVNLLERGAVDTLLTRARGRGVAVIARECLANGLLAKTVSALDIRSYCQSAEEAAVKTAQLDLYRQAAAENGCTLTQLALDYVSHLEGVSVSLLGVSRLQQLESLVSSEIPCATRPTVRHIPHFA